MMPIGLLALSLAAFAIGTGEFVIAGILPDLSADFGVSIPITGLLVSVYAAAVAIGGPVLAMFTTGLPRKPLIVLLLAVFCAGQAFCAVAPSYSWLMAGRVFCACSHGLFFGTGSVAAMKSHSTSKARHGDGHVLGRHNRCQRAGHSGGHGYRQHFRLALDLLCCRRLRTRCHLAGRTTVAVQSGSSRTCDLEGPNFML